MKTVVGFSCIDDYPGLAEAGADELFCGFVPFDLVSSLSPVNRREVRAVNVQIGSISEMRILSDMMRAIGVPVALTFNALCYTPQLLNAVTDLIEQCCVFGFERFIIADPALMLRIRERALPVSIHVSGDMGEMNRPVASLCREIDAKRIIFHRRMSIEAMASCVSVYPEAEYEAFILNELCHFHGGFCSTLHCDALPHACRLPYRLNDRAFMDAADIAHMDPTDVGASGCGLCALRTLQKAGVTHLKLVSRGNYSDLTLRDLHVLRQAIQIADSTEDDSIYRTNLKRIIFPDGCSGKCYYL